jgi:hypothetical protein
VFVNKSVMLTFMVPKVRQLLQRVRFIHVLRDGRPVAYSYARKQQEKQSRYESLYRARGHHYEMPELLRLFAESWSRQVREVSRLRGDGTLEPDRVIEVRYEDLCRDPWQELERISQFLGLDPQRFDTTRFPAIESQDEQYRHHLAPDLLKLLDEATGAARRSAGYGD